MANTETILILFFAAKDGEALYSQQKQDWELAGSDHELLIAKVKVKLLNHVLLFATPWTVAYQAPPSMGFCSQEYWSGFPFPYCQNQT